MGVKEFLRTLGESNPVVVKGEIASPLFALALNPPHSKLVAVSALFSPWLD